MKAFGVFEGGGVRGYAHVGALNAFEGRGVQFVGVAGTSVGAIVAALVAAGYRSDELFAVDNNGNETGLLAESLEATLIHALELRRAHRFRKQREWMRAKGTAFAGSALGRRLAPVSSLFTRVVHGNLEVAAATAVPRLLVAMVASTPNWMMLRKIWASSGAAGTGLLEAWLNASLARKLGMPEDAAVTFADLRLPTMIVATDLSQGSIAVFGSQTHPGMAVAKAVVASAAFPLFFEPARIGDSVYVDGGIVSSFPAWTLDQLRSEQDVLLPTFGFRLAGEPATGRESWPGKRHPQLIEMLKRTVFTALEGHAALETRRIDDLHPIVVRTEVGVLDFHTIGAKRGGLYAKGRREVEDYFRQRLGPQSADRMERLLRRMIDAVRRVTNAQGILRGYVLQPIDDQFCRVVYSALLEDDADDALIMRRGSPSLALSIDVREPVLMRTSELPTAQLRAPVTKYLHALRPEHVGHAYSIPMFDDPEEWAKPDPADRAPPLAALCFDFEAADDRLLLDRDVENFTAALGNALVDEWRDRFGGGLIEPPPTDPPSADWMPIAGMPAFHVSERKLRAMPDPRALDAINAAMRTGGRS